MTQTETKLNFTVIAPEVAALLEKAGAGTWTVEAGESRAQIVRTADGFKINLLEAYTTRTAIQAEVDWDRDIEITNIPYREVNIQTKLETYLYQHEMKDVKTYVRAGVKNGAKSLASSIVMDLLPGLLPLYEKALARQAVAKRLLAAAGGESKLRANYSIAHVDLLYGNTTHIYGEARNYIHDDVEVKLSGLTPEQAEKVLALVAELAKEKTRDPQPGDDD